MEQVLYFAYGSNLDDAQMRARCASPRVVARAVVPNYAYERVPKTVLDEHGQRRRAMTHLLPEDGFEALTPPQGYFDVLWRAYGRLGFDFEPLARAAGIKP